MNRERYNSGFDLALVPTAAEVASFDPESGFYRAVTADCWRVDLTTEPMRNPWNRSCFRVFLYSYWDMGYNYKDERELENIFWNHLKYLRGLFRDLKLPQHQYEARHDSRNRKTRKGSVSPTIFPCILWALNRCMFM